MKNKFLLTFLFLLLAFTSQIAMAQKKVVQYFDTIHDAIKEEYYVINDNGKEIMEGDYVSYYNSGKVKIKSTFKKGNMEGKFVRYHENGGIEITEGRFDVKYRDLFQYG